MKNHTSTELKRKEKGGVWARTKEKAQKKREEEEKKREESGKRGRSKGRTKSQKLDELSLED